MGFHQIQLDTRLSYGFEGGPGFLTVVQTTASGHEERIARWSEARHRYRAAKELMGQDEAMALREFFLARRGSLYGFRFKDWRDYSSDATGCTPASIDPEDQIIGTGDGSTQTFQLLKTYPYGGGSLNDYVRVVACPVSGTIVAALDGTPTTAFTADTTTGIITFTSAPGSGVVVSAGYEFDVPVRFSEETDTWLNLSAPAFGLTDLSKFELLEILDETEQPETWDAGGSYVDSPTADFTVSAQTGRVLYLDPQSGSIGMFLPVPTHLPGGEYFRVIIDAGSSGTLVIYDDSGAAVTTALSAGNTVLCCLIDDGSTKTWVAL